MKCKALLLSAALLLSVTPLTVYADTEDTAASVAEEETQPTTERPKTEDGLYSYTILEDGTACLYMFLPSDYEGEIVVPSEVDGITVTKIDEACFYETYSLKSVVIPATVTEIGPNAFLGCRSIQEFIVEEGNPYYTVQDGVLFANDGEYLICYPAGKTDETYKIPDGVTEIAPGAFGFADDLKYADMPDGLQFIDNWAFAYSGIERIALPDSIVQLDDYCFAYCTDLTEVDLGEGIEKIYNASFAFCENLTEIEFPASLSYIGQYAFAGTGLRMVTIPATVTEIDFCAFGYNANLTSIGGFVIKGYAGSAAQSYCSAVDEDNDYKNNFNFVDLSNPDNAVSEAEDSAADSNADTTEEQQDTEKEPAAKKKSNPLLTILAVCGGVIAVLAAVLVVLLVKKPKSADNDDSADEDEE